MSVSRSCSNSLYHLASSPEVASWAKTAAAVPAIAHRRAPLRGLTGTFHYFVYRLILCLVSVKHYVGLSPFPHTCTASPTVSILAGLVHLLERTNPPRHVASPPSAHGQARLLRVVKSGHPFLFGSWSFRPAAKGRQINSLQHFLFPSNSHAILRGRCTSFWGISWRAG